MLGGFSFPPNVRLLMWILNQLLTAPAGDQIGRARSVPAYLLLDPGKIWQIALRGKHSSSHCFSHQSWQKLPESTTLHHLYYDIFFCSSHNSSRTQLWAGWLGGIWTITWFLIPQRGKIWSLPSVSQLATTNQWRIHGTVPSFCFLGVQIEENPTWWPNTTTTIRNAQQRFYFFLEKTIFHRSSNVLSYCMCVICQLNSRSE